MIDINLINQWKLNNSLLSVQTFTGSAEDGYLKTDLRSGVWNTDLSVQKPESEAGTDCVFSVQVLACVLLSGSVCVLHHQRVREEFRGCSLHSGKTLTHHLPSVQSDTLIWALKSLNITDIFSFLFAVWWYFLNFLWTTGLISPHSAACKSHANYFDSWLLF